MWKVNMTQAWDKEKISINEPKVRDIYKPSHAWKKQIKKKYEKSETRKQLHW